MRVHALLALLALLTASVAHAQDEEPRSFGAPPPDVVRVSAQWDSFVYTGVHPTLAMASATFTSWGNVFSTEVDLTDVVARVLVPLGYFQLSGPPSPFNFDQAELGNLELEALANIELDPEQRLLIGGGIALPTATDPPCSMCSSLGRGVRLAAWMTSFRNPAAWADLALTLWPTLEYRYGVPWVLLGVNAAVPIFIPTDSVNGGSPALAHGQVEIMVTLDVSVAVRLANIVDVGLSLLAWALPTGIDFHPAGFSPDLGQTALSFSLRTDPELDAPVTGGAEFILDLDETWGLTGRDSKWWTLRFFVGGRFDLT